MREKLINKIIVVMESQNWPICIRPYPTIVKSENKRSYYDGSTNTIELSNEKCLIHELCHSTPNPSDIFQIDSDKEKYWYSSHEIQARAIQDFFDYITECYTPWNKLDFKPSRSKRLNINKLLKNK